MGQGTPFIIRVQHSPPNLFEPGSVTHTKISLQAFAFKKSSLLEVFFGVDKQVVTWMEGNLQGGAAQIREHRGE